MTATIRDPQPDLTAPQAGPEGVLSETKLERIVAHLSRRVSEGEWQEGEALPSRNRLAEEYSVSPSTISNAISQLQKAGLVHAVPSRGVFASPAGSSKVQKAAAPTVALRGSYVPEQMQPDVGSSYYGRSLVYAIWDAAHAQNASVVLMPGASEHSRLTRQYCQSQGARGVIFVGQAASEEAVDLRASGFPVVLANRPATASPLNYVDYDQAAALKEAIRRFVEAGHQRIAVVVPPPAAIPHFYDSLKPVFIEALCDHGVVQNFNRYWLYSRQESSGAPGVQSLEAELTALLQSDEPPTAIFCFSYIDLDEVRAAEATTGAKLAVIAVGYHRAIDAKVSAFVLQHSLLGEELLKAMYQTIEDPLVFIQKLVPLIYIDRGTVTPPE